MSLNRYNPGVFSNFGGNRQIGFNRNTWNLGNRIGRAARPYVAGARRRINDYLRTRSEARSSFTDDSRSRKSGTSGSIRSVAPRQQRPGKQISSGGGETKSFTSVVKPKLPMGIVKKMLGKNTVNRNGAGTISCVSGSQNIQALGEYFNNIDIQNAFTLLGYTTAPANAAKAAFLSLHSTHLITNSTTGSNAHCIIYDVMATEDGSDINTSPVLVFTTGGVDTSGGAAADYTIPGTTPFSNPRFTTTYKVIKQTPLILCPGQTHAHRVHYAPNQIVSRERLVTNDGSGPLRGLSMYTFIVFFGTPVHETADEAVVSTGKVKLDYVFMETLEFQGMVFSYPSNSITNTLTALTSPEQWTENTPADTLNIT